MSSCYTSGKEASLAVAPRQWCSIPSSWDFYVVVSKLQKEQLHSKGIRWRYTKSQIYNHPWACLSPVWLTLAPIWALQQRFIVNVCMHHHPVVQPV